MSQLKDLVVTGKARFIGNVYAENIVGKSSEAETANKDKLNQKIDTTYVKDISVNGKTVTFTKGNGSTYSFDTFSDQYNTMPQLSSEFNDKVVQYTGETDSNFTNGYFYKGVEDTYLAPNGTRYKYKYYIYMNFTYQSVKYEADLYTNQKIGALSTDSGHFYVYYNNTIVELSASSNGPGVYTNNDKFKYFPVPGGQQIILDHCVDVKQGLAGFSLYYPVGGYPSDFNINIPLFNNQTALTNYLIAPSDAYHWERVNTQPEAAPYQLPIASSSTLGGIKVGENLAIDNNGVLSASASSNIILATDTLTSAIADGDNADVIVFEFNCKTPVDMVEFFANINLQVSTTVNNNYGDCDLTITYILDDVTKATLIQTFKDGYNIVSLNYILTELTQGNHIFKVNFAPVGGSIS